MGPIQFGTSLVSYLRFSLISLVHLISYATNPARAGGPAVPSPTSVRARKAASHLIRHFHPTNMATRPRTLRGARGRRLAPMSFNWMNTLQTSPVAAKSRVQNVSLLLLGTRS
ncbi:hypothetical protein BDZ97DRAFT_1860122 [Flammula alnicola]|nr:hypothetical protein BDZ97DRAFT_1860122 [Flammula alnicola]